MKTLSTAFLVVLLAICGELWAGAEEARTAYDAGDYATALREWLSLAEAGDANAQFSLGGMYERGLGTRPNYQKAMHWYLMAAEQGHPLAQYTVGMMSLEGYGVDPDWSMAAQWFREAAEQGLADAQYQTGLLSRYGPDGMTGNYREEARWYRRAAEQDHALAQFRLGSLYHEGLGVPQDYVLAYMWFNLAVANGYNAAISNRFDVAAEMTDEQIAEAQQLTRERIAQSQMPQ